MEVVAGTVKPLGRRDRKLSNVTPLIGYFLHRYFRHTKVSPTPKYRGFENKWSVIINIEDVKAPTT